MRELDLNEVKEFVNENIVRFHENKLKCLQNLNLKTILRKKNPYLFKAKNISSPYELIRGILEALLSSSEEKIFGDFLEDLATFISGKTTDGRKSAATGIDLEFVNSNTLYLVSIKSGPNWGNAAQQKKQEADLQKAVKIVKQSKRRTNVEPVLGICYGKTKTTYLRGYMKVVGQNFWYFISHNQNLYTDIIEPLGYKAIEHNEAFTIKRGLIENAFAAQLVEEFCIKGTLDWKKLVQFNSGNLDLELS